MGPRDLAKGTCELARRDTKTKDFVSLDGLAAHVREQLDDIQSSLTSRVHDRIKEGTHVVDTWDEFLAALDKGGFLSAHWDGTAETEERIKQETKATIRCIPYEGDTTPGTCIKTGAPSARRVLFAKAY
jgi:prolyl-tRNA synthetase